MDGVNSKQMIKQTNKQTNTQLSTAYKKKNITVSGPTSVLVSFLSVCPHSVSSLADLRTVIAS